jgi:class 3 adenylate cyclase
VAQQALAPLADAPEASTDAGRGDTSKKAPVEGAAPGTPAPRAGVVPAFLGKRRQLSVLSCEIVIPVEFSSNADLEDLCDTIDACHRRVAETAARHTGVVAKRIGNG